jgi:hypothetical protein
MAGRPPQAVRGTEVFAYLPSVMMRFILLLLTGLIGGTSAPPDPSALPDGVQIQSFEFRPISKEGEAAKVWIPPDSTNPRAYEDSTRSSRPGQDSSVYTLEKKPPQERDGFEVYLQLKNSGARTISRVDWDFLFVDSESGSELKKFAVSSKNKIKSGEVKLLSKQVLPALFLGNKTKPDFAKGKPVVVIRSIEFADGSKWQCALRKP